jgi:hypothetical protein
MLSKFNWDFPSSCGRIGMSIFGTILKHCSIEVQKYIDGIFFSSFTSGEDPGSKLGMCAQQICDETGISQNTLVFTCKLYHPCFIVLHLFYIYSFTLKAF